jgi:hypothetical protein
MGRTCRAHGGDVKCTENFNLKYWMEEIILETRRKSENNIKMALYENGCSLK